MIDRREFMMSGALTLAAAGLIPLTSGLARAENSVPDKAFFDARLDDWFHVRGDSWQSMQLVAVNEGPPQHMNVSQFSIELAGASSVALEEGAYMVQGPGGGSFTLFMQPLEADGSEQRYLALFSEIVTSRRGQTRRGR